ncbi:glycine--tRNA ligase subunit beta [Pediococcus acidilactici]|jgi:glycyl-tRNA synthetase beta chain|uniref:glycine--tRNA ligase subunit beta n=1 Tax=Pediococcus TaxID=1253 RepID=UPI0006B4DF95|nr:MULTISPECIES: glycine--tRNA ligase subunit beta [Pediococcus]KAF0373197.1 glycine--tRNA ligase subunit beta [Pediococcus acidilactici]KAF0383611.1 glycine--tRNA ligase subunit beta [Pediococcus acidilactici]KAF0457596.1 glycine--tRNA ligase subunit beta [Pediococcus acidilactici]KAF0476969.1 glycine--tRNA ligase subunit beta [Pediococcus acidilactici]KAF0537495.1 glycine--tRNA ligase subunit beta [Pediococcus acidilactici]
MAHSYLLEIGLEEIPAHVVTPSIQQLAQKVAKFLKENRLSYDSIEQFSTPRRLAIRINGLGDRQPDIEEDAKGPARKIAQDADGNWTKAAIGFTKGQGLTVDDITFKTIKGTEYVYVHKLIQGKTTQEILPGIKDVVESLNFPTMMKWANYDFKFVRPIRWLVSILDDEVLPFQILDIKAGRQSQGHRFLGKAVDLANPSEYEEKLQAEFVIVDAEKRKALIREQIQAIAQEENWEVTPNADLLEEVNNLVEWPTAFSGKFDPKYLAIPEEVLITSMRDHQRFFFVRNQDGKLLPNFISVRNGNKEHLENVIRGNEKVLTARLEDAAFFYDEDQKNSIDYYVDRLKKVSFHDKIGTMAEKMTRVGSIAQVIAKMLGLDAEAAEDLQRAAAIYKFDLVTGMVGEFPELQGVMGEKYALLKGEKPAVAQAIREHYMPNSAEGELPESTVGAVLALADKFDNIFSFFSAGMIPSGSNDPYALRRHAYGIVRILAQRDWSLDLNKFEEAVKQALADDQTSFGVDVDKNFAEVVEFFNDRIKQYLDHQSVSYDIEDAVLAGSQHNVTTIIAAAEVLTNAKAADSFKDEIEALTRVQRIATKNTTAGDLAVDPQLFNNETEGKLFDLITKIEAMNDSDMAAFFKELTSLTPAITEYFDATMVMDKDAKIKANRLNMMSRLANLVLRVGDLTKVMVK